MSQPYCHFLRFMDDEGTTVSNFIYQNYFVAQTITYEGLDYSFGPFGVNGLVSSSGGDNPKASLFSIPDDITVNVFATAILNNYYVEICTVLLIPTDLNTFNLGETVQRNIFKCSGGNTELTMENPSISITLSNTTDATVADIPNGVLSAFMVGSLPPNGSISIA